MKVVLTQDVEKIGKKGEVVEVARGYGVNYLINNGLGLQATKEAIARAKVISKRKKEKAVEAESSVEQIARKFENNKVQITANASKGGTLYGSLSADDVRKHLEKVWKLDGKDVEVGVDLAQPIKDTGKYPLEVKLTAGGVEKKIDIILTVVLE